VGDDRSLLFKGILMTNPISANTITDRQNWLPPEEDAGQPTSDPRRATGGQDASATRSDNAQRSQPSNENSTSDIQSASRLQELMAIPVLALNQSKPVNQTADPTTPGWPQGGRIWNFSDNGTERELKGISVFRENAGPWALKVYERDPSAGNVGTAGCTITAIANASSVVRQKNPSAAVPNPSNANANDGVYRDTVMKKVSWNSLMTEKSRPLNTAKSTSEVETPTGKPIVIDSDQGKKLLERIYDAVKSGKPVVLGMDGHTPDGQAYSAGRRDFVRHSVVVTGVVEGKRGTTEGLIIRDNWRDPSNSARGSRPSSTKNKQESRRETLDKTLQAYDGTKGAGSWRTIDMAISAAPKK
jgi:hypothetical protein